MNSPEILRVDAAGLRSAIPGLFLSLIRGIRYALYGLDRTSRSDARREASLTVVSLMLAAGLVVWRTQTHLPPLLAIAGVLLPIALLISRRPLLAWRVNWLVGVLGPIVADEARLDYYALAVEALLFAFAAIRYRRPTASGMVLLNLISLWVWVDDDWSTRLILSLVFVLLAVAIDALTGLWGTRQDLAVQTELTRTESDRRAVLEERARIAREMHDIVAHHLSLIAVQTSTLPYRVPDVSDAVRGELESLNASAREALADTRSLLSTLRENDGADRAPQPTMADIESIVENTRRAGVEVSYAGAGDGARIRPATAICAYRIVQEAVSNAVRHAPGSAIDVAIEDRPAQLLVRIHNSVPPWRASGVEVSAGGRGGHGLFGMRERVRLLGGHLRTGPTDDGGFEVIADLPTTEPR